MNGESGRRIAEAELHAWLDGRLEPERRAAIEDWLAANPGEAERLASYHTAEAGLRELYAPVLEEPLPARLLDVLAQPAPPQPPQAVQRPWLRAAMVAGCLLGAGIAGAFGGWFGHARFGGDWPVAAGPDAAFVERAVYAHAVYVPEVRHPVEVAAAESQHLFGWLSKRMGHTIRAPGLEALGFELLGGRLLPGEEGRPAAQFMYQNADGRRLTLYVNRCDARGETSFRFHHEDSLNAFYWLDGELGYALVGDVSREELSAAAHQVYRQLAL